MTDYAVGDIQGCFEHLISLLDKIHFDPDKDRLIAAGDLVNRGPKSLETLRYCMALGDAFAMVLGNHELHLLAIAHGVREPTPKDTISEILEAPDADELLDWLQRQPLMLNVKEYTIVHAGIPPQWTLTRAQSLAEEVHHALISDGASDYFRQMYGDYPEKWSEDLEGSSRLRVITNYLTRMRFCTSDGILDLQTKDTLSPPTSYRPWFDHPLRKTASQKIIFGHWAALKGRYCGPNLFPLDTGCVWGGPLRVMNLTNQVYREYSK